MVVLLLVGRKSGRNAGSSRTSRASGSTGSTFVAVGAGLLLGGLVVMAFYLDLFGNLSRHSAMCIETVHQNYISNRFPLPMA